MATLKYKQYTYNFIGGGWNTEWAKTKKGAIAQSLKRWGKGNSVNVNSFRLSTDKELKELMSLFY